MADFTPSKKTAQDFNNGIEYIDDDPENGIMGDAVKAESINSVIEGLLYTQGLAVNQPDVSEANQVGTVSASIITAPDGTARLKLSNLKGKQGIGISTIVAYGVDANGGNIYKITLDDGRTYNFVAPKGAKGDKGDDGNSILATNITYAVSTSGTVIPTDSQWQNEIPAVEQGKYLWTKTRIVYTNTPQTISYTVAYQGKDGAGFSLMDWLNINFPVGGGERYIQFPNAQTPAQKFPNTSWEIDTSMQGRTIVGSGGNYTFGATGGAETHAHGNGDLKARLSLTFDGRILVDGRDSGTWESNYRVLTNGSGGSFAENVYDSVQVIGNTENASTMQPYAVANFWKRTA